MPRDRTMVHLLSGDAIWRCVAVILCLALCTLHPGQIEAKDITRRQFSGHNGDHKTVFLSPSKAPPTSLYGDVFIYTFHNLDSGYVRMVFTRFHLPSANAILKVYDGSDSTGESTVFTGDDTPAYQSSGPHTYMVLKIYDIKQSDRPPEFVAQITFTNESRSVWANHSLPSAAYCKVLHIEADGGMSSGVQSVSQGRGWVNHNCLWHIHDEIEGKLVIGLNDQSFEIDREFSVTKETERWDPSEVVSIQGQQIYRSAKPRQLLIYSGRNFHIGLTATLRNHVGFSFGYHQNQTKAIAMMEAELKVGVSPSCPYKSCRDGRCVLYWEPCQDVYSDADSSCDLGVTPVMDAHCGSHCYNLEWDACDTIRDCARGQDESCYVHVPKNNNNRNPTPAPGERSDADGTSISTKLTIAATSTLSVFIFCVILRCKPLACCLKYSCSCLHEFFGEYGECFCLDGNCRSLVTSCFSGLRSCGSRLAGSVVRGMHLCRETGASCYSNCTAALRRQHHQPPPEESPPTYNPEWTEGPAVVMADNPPVSSILHTDIAPPSYAEVTEGIGGQATSRTHQQPGPQGNNPGRGDLPSTPMVDRGSPGESTHPDTGIPPPSYTAATSPQRRPVGYRQPVSAGQPSQTDGTQDRLRAAGDTSEPPPSYDSVWN